MHKDAYSLIFCDLFRILSEFNENNAHETSNQDGSYSNDANIDAKKIGWHGISKDKDETKRISRSNNYGDPWKPRSSILDEERTEKDRAKGFIKYFILKKILQSKKYANMHIDAFDEISLADPFTSAAEESKLLDRNYFENVKCDINPLAFISLVEKMSFGTFSQMLFGGISMLVHVNMK